jgi:hypothetical protein
MTLRTPVAQVAFSTEVVSAAFCPCDCSSSRFVHQTKSRFWLVVISLESKTVPSLGLILQGAASVPRNLAIPSPHALFQSKNEPSICWRPRVYSVRSADLSLARRSDPRGFLTSSSVLSLWRLPLAGYRYPRSSTLVTKSTHFSLRAS